MLVSQEKYLSVGAHIGTRMKHGSMKKYIYKTRDDGLHVLDLKKLDEKLAEAAELLNKYDAEKVFVVGNKDNAKNAIMRFCELTGCKPVTGRFTPGRFTNPSRPDFCEPEFVLVVDPGVDKQAVKEAFYVGAPVIAFCDTNNSTKYIDLCVPTNNKGRKSIAMLFWILAREILKHRGVVARDEEFEAVREEFEA